MEQTENTHKVHQRWFILIVTVYVLLILSGCKKLLGVEELKLSGKIIDDITGENVTGSGSIRVDGHDANAGTWFGIAYQENIGSGTIRNDGTFECSFKKWTNATDYYFYISHNNGAYIFFKTLYIDAADFATGSYNKIIKASKLTTLKIRFRNTAPVDTSDRLYINITSYAGNMVFGGERVFWEDLQNCSVRNQIFVYGGINATGTLSSDIASDRKTLIGWQTVKGGIGKQFYDSTFCPRNTTTTYSLNY